MRASTRSRGRDRGGGAIDRRLRALALAGLGGFVLLLVLVAVGVVDGLDRAVRAAAEGHRVAGLYDAADVLTDVVSPPVDAGVLAVGAVGLAARRRHWAPLAVAAVAGWAVVSVVLVVKAATDRAAPADPAAHGGSFPSGHTAAVLVCLGTLVLLATRGRPAARNRLLWAVAVLTVLVGAALVYDDFHWLTDTVASAALGVAVLAAVAGVSRHPG